MEVWENERLQWEHEPTGRVFPCYFEFSQTFTRASITYGNKGGNVSYFFYEITHRKLKRGNSLLYQGVNSPYRSRCRMRWRIIWREPFHVFHTVIETRSKLPFSKCWWLRLLPVTSKIVWHWSKILESVVLCTSHMWLIQAQDCKTFGNWLQC